MTKALYQELEKLGPAEKLKLAHELFESVVDADLVAPPLTEDQLAELRRRVAHLRANPTERRWTLTEIWADLGLK